MASSINASTSGGGGIITTADATGNLNIQSGGSTVVAVTSAGATVTGTLAATGGLQNLVTGICEGRLTLTSGTAVTTADVTGATTVYFAPYNGNRIALYDGTNWLTYSFTERSLALGTLTTLTPYDVYIYNNSGTLTLEFLAWTNGTTRATALVLQDGVYVKTGATTRRYLGTFYTTATTTTEDSAAKRYLYNYNNRAIRLMSCATETTDNWTYSTATWRQARASTANQLNFFVGVVEDSVSANLDVSYSSATVGSAVGLGIGLNSTTQPSGNFGVPNTPVAGYTFMWSRNLRTYPVLGLNYMAWLEYSQSGLTTTFYGDAGAPTLTQSGIKGEILA
jgi:hypothetical protein